MHALGTILDKNDSYSLVFAAQRGKRADELCVTAHTARSQLKSIFAKTGAQSQSGLLMLLATSTLAHCRDAKNHGEDK